MKKITLCIKKIVCQFNGKKCPRCGDWIPSGDDCCESCGYPWNN